MNICIHNEDIVMTMTKKNNDKHTEQNLEVHQLHDLGSNSKLFFD